ncbi:MAG: hypothetical protein IJ093_03275 [Bacilli bacterium]|nr:hypothetical protein [Bacilli bacterium]
MDTKKLGIGILVFLIAVLGIIGLKNALTNTQNGKKLTTVYGAVGGGKENLLADEEFTNILTKKYKINVVNDTWSNGKLIVNDVVRENGTNYDFIFFSDQRFYDYYKLSPNAEKGEAKRYTVQKGSLTLNTPVVIYSWDTVTDALINENIVTEKDGVYYITDMNKLLNYILEGKTWNDLGLSLYGKINIDSTDPVTSSPGATYYGLLASIMGGGRVNDENIDEILPKLKEFYKKSGYMNNTPADLFQLYLKTGVGAKPMIVDYEKSIIDFANSDPEGYNSVKDKIRILYPSPTIWNSHCIASLTENGNTYYAVFEDKDVQQLAWEKYGFRTGVTGGNYDVSKVIVKGIPQSIDGAVSSLKMNMYEKMIESLKN